MIAAGGRSRFPVLERFACLNAGTCGPLSRATAAGMQEWAERDAREGRGGGARFGAMFDMRKRVIERLATLVHVPADRLLMTASTTEGCNIVVTGLRLGPGDEVVSSDAEHPGLESPLRASGAEVRVAKVLHRPAAGALDAVLAEVTTRTRLIAVSHVLWLNGHVMPIAEIKRRTGLPLLVDGAQSVGAIPVDASVADWYTISGQKWLCGPELTGALYVADPSGLQPCMAGYGLAHSDGVDRFGLTFHPAPSIAGLLAAVAEFPAGAFERAATMVARCRELLLAAGLEVPTEAGQGTLVSFVPRQDAAEVVARAADRGVIVRSLPNGWIRASCGWWTDEGDLQRLLEAVA